MADHERNDLFEFRVQVSAESSTIRQVFPSSFSQDCHSFVSASKDEVVIWDLKTDEVSDVVAMKSKTVTSACFSGAATTILVESKNAVYSNKGKKRNWKLEESAMLTPLDDNGTKLFILRTKDVKGNVISSSDGTVLGCLDLSSLEIETEMLDSEDDYLLIRCSKSCIAIAKRFDVVVGIFDQTTFSCIRQIIGDGEENAVDTLTLSDTHIAILSPTSRLSVYHIEKEGTLWTVEGVCCTAFSPNGRRLIVSTDEGTSMRIINAGLISHAMSPPHPDDEVQPRLNLACFSNDGTIVAGADESTGAIYLWDAEFGSVIGILGDAEGMVTSLTFSKCGRRLAATVEGGTELVWDLFSGHRERLLALCAHPDRNFRLLLPRIREFLF